MREAFGRLATATQGGIRKYIQAYVCRCSRYMHREEEMQKHSIFSFTQTFLSYVSFLLYNL